MTMRLAVRLPNWVGDVCMALPAVQLLASRGFELQLFGRAWAPDLLAGLDLPVHALPTGLLAGAAALRASTATRGLLFPNSFSSALQMRLAGISPTGYRGDGRRFLLNQAVDRAPDRHEVQSFWTLARAVLDPSDAAPGVPPALHLTLTARHKADAARALDHAGVGAAFVVLCPMAAGTAGGKAKVWPGFADLAGRLAVKGATVVACPGPGEEAACASALPEARRLDGLGLGAYAAVLARAAAVVANDSGPMHVAAAVQVPVLGVFGASDPRRTRPWAPAGAAVGDARGWPDVDTVLDALGRIVPFEVLRSGRT